MNQTQLGPSSERRDRSLFLSFMVRQSCYLLHLLIVINETNMSFMTLSCCNLEMTTWGGKMDNNCFLEQQPHGFSPLVKLILNLNFNCDFWVKLPITVTIR